MDLMVNNCHIVCKCVGLRLVQLSRVSTNYTGVRNEIDE
jgi:hypothetical protein